MKHFDRDYYRALGTHSLLTHARENGLNPELAIAVTERLAAKEHWANLIGHFHFNKERTHEL